MREVRARLREVNEQIAQREPRVRELRHVCGGRDEAVVRAELGGLVTWSGLGIGLGLGLGLRLGLRLGLAQP